MKSLKREILRVLVQSILETAMVILMAFLFVKYVLHII